MTKTPISDAYAQSPQMRKLQERIASSQDNIFLKGLAGSSLSFVLSQAFLGAGKPFLLVFSDKEEAAYQLNDLEQLIGEQDVLFYPGSYRRPYQIEQTDNANVLLRAEVLNRINSRKKPAVIVTYPDALFEKVVTRKELEKNTLHVKRNDTISLDFLNEVLFEYQFARTDFVTEPGEFSVRGGIVDVFSFSHDQPYRIEFFGDEVDSIRTFDVETQLSNNQVQKISIIPNVANTAVQEKRESFLQYISSKTVVYTKNEDLLFARLDDFFGKAKDAFTQLSAEIQHAQPQELFVAAALFREQMGRFCWVSSSQPPVSPEKGWETVVFNTKPQPSFNKKFDVLIQNLNDHMGQG
ncbi:MAG: transcription-repair coupling factor, partial [Bacteroidota bacterium]